MHNSAQHASMEFRHNALHRHLRCRFVTAFNRLFHRAQLGAVQSRLNFTNEQLVVTKENLSSAISRITDVDVAEEATQYARYQILVQSGTQMLRQANQLPASALQLLTI